MLMYAGVYCLIVAHQLMLEETRHVHHPPDGRSQGEQKRKLRMKEIRQKGKCEDMDCHAGIPPSRARSNANSVGEGVHILCNRKVRAP